MKCRHLLSHIGFLKYKNNVTNGFQILLNLLKFHFDSKSQF